MFAVDDTNAEYERLTGLGVGFTVHPMRSGPVIIAILHGMCGDLIQLDRL